MITLFKLVVGAAAVGVALVGALIGVVVALAGAAWASGDHVHVYDEPDELDDLFEDVRDVLDGEVR